jgi:hypothetical protein
MDINTLYGILAAIVLSVVIMLFQKKKKQASWKGTVTKIKEKLYDPANYSENDTSFKDFVDVYYRTDSGKKGKLHLYKNQFDSLYPQLKRVFKILCQLIITTPCDEPNAPQSGSLTGIV